MAAKKINKEFLLTDNSINVYGFRLLTEGYMAEKYMANPIGYRQHKRKDGVVLKWEDFRYEGDKLFAKPVINLSNPLGKQTADEVENGFLNAASVGSIVVVDFSDDPSLMLPGQTGPTITKWYNKEISLVDVPGNENALVTQLQLFDVNDQPINLTDFIQATLRKLPNNLSQKSNTMPFKLAVLAALAVSGINLSAQSSDESIVEHIKDLAQKANKLPDLESQVSSLKTAKETAELELQTFKANAYAVALKNLTDDALKAGKLTVKAAADLSVKYADDPEGLKALIDGLPAYVPATERIAEGAQGVQDLAAKSFDELDKSGQLEAYKAADLEGFKAKFKAHFGTEYNK